jgi:hypothetical protein
LELRLVEEEVQRQVLISKCSTETAFVTREEELVASSQSEEQVLVSRICYSKWIPLMMAGDLHEVAQLKEC